MSYRCCDIIAYIDEIAPVWLAEDWDNTGLIIGSRRREVNRIMVCLDITSKVIDEAVEKKIDLIVSHHPLIFKGMKRISQDDFMGGRICKLIKNDIAVYCAHTNLDTAANGINRYLAELLHLKSVRNLRIYKTEKLYKIVVFVPEESMDGIREAMCGAGAGWIGNYSDCTFAVKGVGTFKPLQGTNPYTGMVGKLEHAGEYRLETIVPESRLEKVIEVMLAAHPYEEAAYDVYPLELKGYEYGMGKIGLLDVPNSLEQFVSFVKSVLNIENIKLIGFCRGDIQKVAVFCGSFDEDYSGIMKEKPDVVVTGDIKHHTAVDMSEMGLCVLDAGHFGTERIIVPHIVRLIGQKFPGIETAGSSMEENPFKYM